MANTTWSDHMTSYLNEKLATEDKAVITPEQLESQGIVALKDIRTGKTTPVRWLAKLPTVGEFQMKLVIPIFKKEPQGLIATD